MLHRIPFTLATATLLLLSGTALPQNPAKQGKKLAQQQKQAVEKVADSQVKQTEAERLRAAYIFLAMANHDYDGHRAKAMAQIHDAVHLLDASIMKNGTKGQKVLAHDEDVAAARAKFVAKHSAKVHEPQALSDLQMREGLKLVASVQPVVAKRKQPRVLAHVDKAIEHINIALRIR